MSILNYSSTLIGVEARLVGVEVVVSSGLPGLTVVGLPDAAVSEAGARVRSALKRSGVSLPPRRVVINLSPADLRKSGSGFDLALALGLLEALGEIPKGALKNTLVLGELSLSGEVRSVRGEVSSLALASASGAVSRLMISAERVSLLPHWEGVEVVPVSTLTEARDFCLGKWRPSSVDRRPVENPQPLPDLSEVRGQEFAKLAIEVSAAGGHHLALVGPPGCGKSLLASCLPGLMPPLTEVEQREVAAISSVCEEQLLLGNRPFRAPGCGTSAVALLGGCHPGEVTRAHRGVLFLDEFPEFRRDALESLRAVLERGEVHISRARMRIRYPAHFTLVCAMNPCPCGASGQEDESCVCSPGKVQRYRAKMSGPLSERIDLLVALHRVPLLQSGRSQGESTSQVAERVQRARQVQLVRGALNRDLSGDRLLQSLEWSEQARTFAYELAEKKRQSMRSFQKWLKVSRTLADLLGDKSVSQEHLKVASSLRAHDVD